MIRIFFLFIVFSFPVLTYSQKPALSISSIKEWPSLSNQELSSDGAYFKYDLTIGEGTRILIVESVDKSWQATFQNARQSQFSRDSRWLIIMYGRDSLGFIDLKERTFQYFKDVKSFKIVSRGLTNWIGYQSDDSAKTVTLYNLESKQSLFFPFVEDYEFSNDGQTFLINSRSGDQQDANTVSIIRLSDGNIIKVGNFFEPGNFAFDTTRNRIAFVAAAVSDEDRAIWLYKLADNSLLRLSVLDQMDSTDMEIAKYSISFNANGSRLFYYIQKKKSQNKIVIPKNVPQVDIYNYQDEFLQSLQIRALPAINLPMLGVINFDLNGKARLLQSKGDGVLEFQKGRLGDFFVLLTKGRGSVVDQWKDTLLQPDLYLVSLNTGERTLIKKYLDAQNLQVSSNGKYAIWFDTKSRNWFSYGFLTKVTTNITAKIYSPLYNEFSYTTGPAREGIAGWAENDQYVLIYDRYDLWKVDLDGKKMPINITNGLGRLHKIRFRLVDFDEDHSGGLNSHDRLLLSSFNVDTKENGFYWLSNTGSHILTKAYGDQKVLYFQLRYGFEILGQNLPVHPIRAKNAGAYAVCEMSARQYPNWYLTTDFSAFKSLTNYSPQNYYNWYTTQLVHWTLPDGRIGSGILYKPEDFDSSKKYPVIFYIYERNSDALNLFVNPELSNGIMNIPTYVSNGYLVFVPDIPATDGNVGEDALNAVVSAARYLGKNSWIDIHKMGLQGHSHGGWETNYIVTKTKLFSAAVSCSGPSELISKYSELNNGGSAHFYYETGQGRMGATLWEKPERYIKNSPIFYANKVQTPLLIMHNKNDEMVPWTTQGIAWYSALQSLGKRVWMLQYDREGHTIDRPADQEDFSIRMKQFFDHYLKGSDMPRWMSKGIPASRKGIDLGLDVK